MIELQKETTKTFAGRTLKQGEHVRACMTLSFNDLEGNPMPDETGECEAYVSRIENDKPSFIAVNPYEDKVIAIRQMGLRFVVSTDKLKELWTWTWLDRSTQPAIAAP